MKTNRNDPCPCGSGKKYKHCCYAKDTVKHDEPVIAAPESAEVVDETAEDEGGAPQDKKSHHKDRSRFQGEVRGGTSGFKPRVTRGAQRGS